MAFYITKNGQPNVILTDGGSIEVGENLSVDENGKLNAQAGTEVYVDDELSLESENPVQNKVITKTIEDVEQVTAAALNDLNDKKADRSELAQVAFTGDYNDLENKPTIPEEFTQQQVDWNATSGVTSIKNKPNLARVATTGSYNDLSDKLTAGNNITIENGVISAAGGGSDFDASRIKAGDYIILTYLDENEQEVQSPQDAYYVKIDANIPAMEETISQWERVVANALARHEQAIQELQNA